MIIQAGELWVADIPFTDGSGSKRRLDRSSRSPGLSRTIVTDSTDRNHFAGGC